MNKKKKSYKIGLLMSRQMNRCAYCGEELRFIQKGERDFNNGYLKPTIDHIMPRSRGGKNTEDNWALVHQKCNAIKGNFTPEEIINLLNNMRITFESSLHYPLL